MKNTLTQKDRSRIRERVKSVVPPRECFWHSFRSAKARVSIFTEPAWCGLRRDVSPVKTQKSFFLFLAFMLTLIVQPPAYARRSKIRINGWFWLNSAPKNEWKRDFKKMHECRT